MHPSRDQHPPRAGSMAVRGLLLFLVGALAGANAIYFLMVRDRPPCPAVEVPSQPAPATGEDATGVAARAETPTGEATHSGLPLRVDVRRIPRPTAPSREPAGRSTRTGAAASAVESAAGAAVAVPESGLLLPVAGVAASALVDTFDDTRGTDRIHEALDIMAPHGTPVVAVADGHVEKLFDSDNGGLTIYQFDPTERYAYYYAHLQRYAPGLAEGDEVRRGDVIGYVGSSGNASPEAPHLHFAIFRLGPEKRWWDGTAINPYPFLTRE